jgi:hypothetical protein
MMLYDRRDPDSVLNGRIEDVRTLLGKLRDEGRRREPFICEIVGDARARLLFGMGGAFAFVQYGALSGEPPYLIAFAPPDESTQESLEFSQAGGSTEIPGRYLIPTELALRIVEDFVLSEEPSPAPEWDEV